MNAPARRRLAVLIVCLAAQCLLLGARLRARGVVPGPRTLALLCSLALTVYLLRRALPRAPAGPAGPDTTPPSRHQRLFGLALLALALSSAETMLGLAGRLMPAALARAGFSPPGDGPARLGEEFFERFFAERFDAELGWERADWPPHGRMRRTPASHGRVLAGAYGDSFTACFGPDEETWPAHLAARLQADVWNYGVDGHGPDQTLLKLRREHARRPTPVVLFGVFSEGVARLVNVWRSALDVQFYESCAFADGQPIFEPTKPRFVLEHGRLRLLSNPVRTREDLRRLVHDPAFALRLREHDFFQAGYERERYCPGWRFPYTLALARGTWARLAERTSRPDYAGLLLRDAPTLDLLLAVLEEARRVVAEQRSELLLLIFGARPDLDHYLAHGRHGRLQALFERLDAHGLPYVDTSRVLAEHARGLHPPQGAAVYYDETGHHSMLAHRVLADALAADARLTAARARLP